LNFFRKAVEKIDVSLKPNKKTGTLQEEVFKFIITSRLITLKMRNVASKSFRENQKTHFMFNNFFNCTVYEVMWKNVVGPDRPLMKIGRMRI
jgi:hypothetical protein